MKDLKVKVKTLQQLVDYDTKTLKRSKNALAKAVQNVKEHEKGDKMILTRITKVTRKTSFLIRVNLAKEFLRSRNIFFYCDHSSLTTAYSLKIPHSEPEAILKVISNLSDGKRSTYMNSVRYLFRPANLQK